MSLERADCKRIQKYLEELRELSDKCKIGIQEDGELKPCTDGWSVNGYAENGLCLKYKKEYFRHSIMHYEHCVGGLINLVTFDDK